MCERTLIAKVFVTKRFRQRKLFVETRLSRKSNKQKMGTFVCMNGIGSHPHFQITELAEFVIKHIVLHIPNLYKLMKNKRSYFIVHYALVLVMYLHHFLYFWDLDTFRH